MSDFKMLLSFSGHSNEQFFCVSKTEIFVGKIKMGKINIAFGLISIFFLAQQKT